MTEPNPNARLEAFSDGVFAIALTLLIIDIRIPSTTEITNNNEFWQAIKHLLPGILAFLLSFVTILITWANHHEALKFVNKSSPQFNYANGLLMLSVVFIPFPTSLLGEYVLTDHATPAVVIYSSVFVLQATAWYIMGRAALSRAKRLTSNEVTTLAFRNTTKKSQLAFFFYLTCTILAFWFPLAMAIIIALSWVAWLVVGNSIKEK